MVADRFSAPKYLGRATLLVSVHWVVLLLCSVSFGIATPLGVVAFECLVALVEFIGPLLKSKFRGTNVFADEPTGVLLCDGKGLKGGKHLNL